VTAAGAIRTVLGDVAAGTLGIAYVHEHLIVDSPLIRDRFPHIHLSSVEAAVAEVGECAAAGVGAMVDAMPCAAGRDVVRLAEISRATGVHVVASTGLHTARYYEGRSWIRNEPADTLAELFRADIEVGIDRYDYAAPIVRRTEHRAGIVKVATLGERPTSAERRVFEGAAAACRATGVPILTHCEDGLGALAQVGLLHELGVPLERVVLSHTDKRPDLGYHRELLSSGANLEYDQALRQPAEERGGTAWLLAEMLSEGFGDRLMLGTDGARRTLWRALGGGPGLAWLATGFVEVLSAWGIDEAARRRLLVENPARTLALS
jgi:predicted metal-dependent phosphotriesterase family hydrolase